MHRDVFLLAGPSATGAIQPWTAQPVDVHAPRVVRVLPARLRHADEPDRVRIREAPASTERCVAYEAQGAFQVDAHHEARGQVQLDVRQRALEHQPSNGLKWAQSGRHRLKTCPNWHRKRLRIAPEEPFRAHIGHMSSFGRGLAALI